MSTLPERIKKFEGYYEKPYWDHKQWSVGYGTRASGPNDAVDRAEAERRLTAELAPAAAIVDKHAANLPPGVRDSLVSLTYNAGDAWTRAGLGEAIRSGDMARARELFAQYNKASGEVNPGLVNRRKAELAWWDEQPGTAPQPAPAQTAPNLTPGAPPPPTAASVATTPQQAAGGAPGGLLAGLFGGESPVGFDIGAGDGQSSSQTPSRVEEQSPRISYVQPMRLQPRARLALARAAARRA